MAKKKKTGTSAAMLGGSPTPPSAHAALDPSTLLEVLSADFPLMDPSLISALLSDYEPASLSANIETVRDQLGILQATLVPDDEIGQVIDGLDGLGVESSESSVRSTDSRGPGGDSTERTEVSTEGSEAGDELDVLRSLFPAIPSRELADVLAEYSMDAAIDHLLSLELIHEVETQGHWPGEAPPHVVEREAGAAFAMSCSTSGSSIGSIHAAPLVSAAVHAIQANSGADANKKKTKRKAETRTVALVDTLQRGSRPASGTHTPDAPAGENRWYTLASVGAYLAELTGAPAAHFVSYMHAPVYHSAHAAVRAALAALPAADIADDYALRVLHDVYGDALHGRTGGDLEACVNALGGDVGGVLDLMWLLDDLSYWPSDDDWAPDSGAASALASSGPGSRPLSPALSSKTLSPIIPDGFLPAASHPTPAAPSTQTTGRTANPSRMQRPPTTLKDAKVRIVPGAQPAASSAAFPTALDGPSATSSSTLAGAAKPAFTRTHHPLNWRTVQHARPARPRALHPYAGHIPAYARGTLPNDPTPGSLRLHVPYEPGLLSAQECWDRAQAERDRRRTMVLSAGAHYRGSGVGGAGGKRHTGAVAGHYAAEARAAMDRARAWELRAARAVVDDQLARSGATAIDLHHMTVDEAVELALGAADMWYDRQRQAYYGRTADQASTRAAGFTPPVPLIVITGLGRHSAGQKGVLGPAVGNALEEAGWRVGREAGRGYIVVKGKR
ncbi:hypothetical protein Q5752_004765 [Cryptotrichosporon argae]